MSVFDQNVGLILDNYADVIEGGNSWRGSGDAYKGVPGLYPGDKELRAGEDTPLVAIGASVSTTSFDVASSRSWETARWVSTKAPPFFVVCTTSGAAGSPNRDTVRKVAGWNNTTKVFTIAPALPAPPVAGDVFSVLQGFKRVQNLQEIDDSADGYDRYFHLSAMPGDEIVWHGDGYRLYQTDMHLRIRMLKFGRLHDWTAAAMTNLAIIRSVITRMEFVPQYAKALYSGANSKAEIVTNDESKIVMLDKYTLVYAVDGTYK